MILRRGEGIDKHITRTSSDDASMFERLRRRFGTQNLLSHSYPSLEDSLSRSSVSSVQQVVRASAKRTNELTILQPVLGHFLQ